MNAIDTIKLSMQETLSGDVDRLFLDLNPNTVPCPFTSLNLRNPQPQCTREVSRFLISFAANFETIEYAARNESKFSLSLSVGNSFIKRSRSILFQPRRLPMIFSRIDNTQDESFWNFRFLRNECCYGS
jgi:hypothetical protein